MRRRLALISGMLLTLTAGVWGSALAASAGCLHDMSADAAPASDEHDCCRARIGASNTLPSEHSPATEHAHDAEATHAPSQPQSGGAHARTARMDCEAAETQVETRAGEAKSLAAEAFGEGGRSCFECCAGRANQLPATATISAPEQHRVKRAASNASVCAHDLFAPAASGVAHLTPSQHAPPAPHERRHMLISVFLI